MADTVTTPPRQPRIFHGWYIVGIAVTAGMLLSGFQTYAFGFFFKPMSEELEIGRGATSAVLLIRAVIMGALALPIGMAVDRYGPAGAHGARASSSRRCRPSAWHGSAASSASTWSSASFAPSPSGSRAARSAAPSSPSGSSATGPSPSPSRARASRWAASSWRRSPRCSSRLVRLAQRLRHLRHPHPRRAARALLAHHAPHA